MASFSDSFARRWRLLYSRLNELECREIGDDQDRVMVKKLLEEAIGEGRPRQVLLKPSSAEVGPPCRVCRIRVTSALPLVACSLCLRVYHRGCWTAWAPCPVCRGEA